MSDRCPIDVLAFGHHAVKTFVRTKHNFIAMQTELNSNGVLDIGSSSQNVVKLVYELDQIRPALEVSPVVMYNGGTSLEALDEVAKLFGGAKENKTFDQVRDIIPKATENGSIAHSMAGHPPHIDGTFMERVLSLFMLQCVVPDLGTGGYGLFWPIKPMLEKMPAEIFQLLQKTDVQYGRLREDGVNGDYYVGKMIFEFEGRWCIRWRCDNQVKPLLYYKEADDRQKELFQDALLWVLNYLNVTLPEVVPYKEGDICIVRNLAVLHGRTPIISPNRLMRRAWLNF